MPFALSPPFPLPPSDRFPFPPSLPFPYHAPMKTRFLMANTFASVVAAVLVAQAGGPTVVYAAEHTECSHLVTLKLPDVKVTEAVAVLKVDPSSQDLHPLALTTGIASS